MLLTPTTLQLVVDLGIADYRRKQTKKAEPSDPAFLQINRLCVSLLLKFSPDSCQANQAKTEEKHSGGLRDGR